MGVRIRGRWLVQLRLGLEAEAELVEVWATLSTEDRVVAIERLAAVMANVVAAVVEIAPGEERADEDIESSEGVGDVTRIA